MNLCCLLVGQTFDRYISSQCSAENLMIPENARRIHKQSVYEATMLLMLVLRLRHRFLPMNFPYQSVAKHEED